MISEQKDLSPHSKKVLDLLSKSDKPLSAYDILGKLHKHGIKAPPTVYRALDSLVERGLAHRIESLNAFVSCHSDHPHEHEENVARFAVCRSCGTTTEIQNRQLSTLIEEIGRKLKFHVEREMIELLGLCRKCSHKPNPKKA